MNHCSRSTSASLSRGFKSKLSDFLSAVLAPIYSGIGGILCLHRVLDEQRRSRIGANRALEITPEFLDEVLYFLQSQSCDVISLDAAVARLNERRAQKRFVCFTFDDGYLDNLETAYPIFKKYGAPFTVFLTTSFVEGGESPWWYLLERLFEGREEVRFHWDGSERRLPMETKAHRENAFALLAGSIRGMDQTEKESFLRHLAEGASLGPNAAPRDLMMSWEQARLLGRDPLVTIGAHSVHHLTLNRLNEHAATREMAESKQMIEEQIGRPVEHFSYPFGGSNAVGRREFTLADKCGFKTMTTTRGGNLFSAHRDHLHCLPRFTVSGNYQTLHHLRGLLSGAAAAFQRPFRRVVTE